MKMSNVFKVNRDIDIDDFDQFNLDEMDAAAHAINQHDALVAMNAELIINLERALTSACDPYACSEDFCDYMLEELDKAKELSQ